MAVTKTGISSWISLPEHEQRDGVLEKNLVNPSNALKPVPCSSHGLLHSVGWAKGWAQNTHKVNLMEILDLC